MPTFSPHQRWTSEGEPELGPGLVTQVSKGRVTVHFPASGETRIYATASAPLRRVRFKPGDTIADSQNRPLVVESVREQGELIVYLGQGRSISEADLGQVTVRHGADDRLLSGQVDPPQLFALRRRTLHHNHHLRSSPVHGFLGGRIDLIPHQLYIAQEVSTRYAPRVLLSDEVGLGKTIEACLILHRLLLQGRISRVMILVPESLIHQWFVELLRRFNLWFHIFDEERCVAIEDSAPEGNPFLDDQLIICSTDFLAGTPRRAGQALSAGWDMLVVDEAHHLNWSPEQAGLDYLVVQALSQVAGGLLLLTATPEQLGLASHFARLQLLDPERYRDFDSFQNASLDHRDTADLVEKLANKTPLEAADEQLLSELLGPARLDQLKTGDATVRNHLIEDLLDQHGPGRVLFRNTRAAMQGFPKRKAHLVRLAPTRPDTPLGEDPRFPWLQDLMKELQPAKVLLICRTKAMVLTLEKALRERMGLKAAVFHEDLTLVQRDRNAAWFAETDGAPLLLCSEIGSEGRNFQFAHHLVLFDLPEHPELLEQRIGRLDRIGQTQDIQIHVPYSTGSVQEAWVRWYHEGLNAFEANLQGGNKIAREFGERLRALSAGSEHFDAELTALIADTQAFHQALKNTLAQGRDRLLEMNSFRPQVAEKLVTGIRAEDQDRRLENYMLSLFEHFNTEVEDLAPRTYLVQPSPDNAEVFPTMPEEGMTLTFDRKRALSREEVSFLSWDHPLVRGAVESILVSELGNASFAVLPGAAAPGIIMELLFVLETVGGTGNNVDRFLSQTPLRVVVDHAGVDVTDAYPVEELEKRLRPGQVATLLDNETLVETVLPAMVSAATEIAEVRGRTKISLGLRRMRQGLSHEIDRLKALQEKNKHIRPEEIRIAEAEQEQLADSIMGAQIRLDALQLIYSDSQQ